MLEKCQQPRVPAGSAGGHGSVNRCLHWDGSNDHFIATQSLSGAVAGAIGFDILILQWKIATGNLLKICVAELQYLRSANFDNGLCQFGAADRVTSLGGVSYGVFNGGSVGEYFFVQTNSFLSLAVSSVMPAIAGEIL